MKRGTVLGDFMLPVVATVRGLFDSARKVGERFFVNSFRVLCDWEPVSLGQEWKLDIACFLHTVSAEQKAARTLLQPADNDGQGFHPRDVVLMQCPSPCVSTLRYRRM